MSERSITDILRDTLNNVQEMVRSEIQLARIETKDELRKASSAGIMFGAALLFAVFGFGFCMLCVLFALALVMPGWAAALIVGVALLLMGATLLSVGRERWKKVKMPEKTVFTVKEDLAWMRNQSRS